MAGSTPTSSTTPPGVDTSDHEVNLKILLDRVVKDGDLTEKQRNSLLAEMTDEVAALVLRDNYEQNLALANAVAHAPSLLHVHEEWIRRLERDGLLDRELEGLPSSKEVKRRLDRGEGLSAPELSVLMSWTKIVLADELLDSEVADDHYFDQDLRSYFPHPIQQGFEKPVHQHPLRREIIVTQVVNDLVNGAGMTFWPRLAGETGVDAAELTRANFVAREIFGSLADARGAGVLRQPSSRRACRPGCGSRCGPWSSGRRGGWSTTGAPRSTARAPSTSSPGRSSR